MKTPKSFFLFLLFIITTTVRSQEHGASAYDQEPIEYTMVHNAELALENPEITSVSIGIYKNGKTYTEYFGAIDNGKENPANDDSLFEIASVTKSFTGILIAQAVLDGKISLQDDIRSYLDGSYEYLEYEGRPIQIRDLLTHTSGIRRDLSPTLAKQFSLEATATEKAAIAAYNREGLYADLKTYRLDTVPGSRYDYSPVIGAELLALALEKSYQKPYEQLLNEHILQKAGMHDTHLNKPEIDQELLVNGYTAEGDLVTPQPLIMSGAGYALKSNIPDLLNYVKYLLESPEPVIQEMQKTLFYDEEEGDGYGYFWQLGDDSFMHSGGTNGGIIWVIVLPKHNAGFTVTFNSNGGSVNRWINKIADAILDDIENFPKKNPYFPIRSALMKHTDEGIRYYKTLKSENGADYSFEDDNNLNQIGYELLGEERVTDAIKVFQLLVSEFPDMANPYDSLGEAYLINEQFDLALTNYKKALELNPDSGNARKMIQEINELKKEP